MGFGEFLIYVVVVVVLAAVASWLIGQVPATQPNTIALFQKGIWILAVLIVVYLLLTATGILGKDIRIPHV